MYKNKKGFTLVEIIIVLLILGILAAIAIPTMLGYVKEARESAVLGNARNYLQSVQSIAIKEYGFGNAYSPWAPSDLQVTYEAITNKRKRPDEAEDHKRIKAIYDLFDINNVDGLFEAIAVVDHGKISIVRYKDETNNIILEWKKSNKEWVKLDVDKHKSWAKDILPEGLFGRGIWWNGYAP